MNALDYLKLAGEAADREVLSVTIDLVTNFTDGVLQKLLCGVLRAEGINAEIRAVPYKQYHLHLKSPGSGFMNAPADMTYMFFDVNSYRRSAFLDDPEYLASVLDDVAAYASATTGPVVLSMFQIPYIGVYGNLFEESPAYGLIRDANERLRNMARDIPNLYLWDVNALIHRMGESHIRDLRGLYAFDMPFTNDFLLAVAREWAALVRAKMGKTKKCVVVDLDNTLWGGIVGEVGHGGILLGPDHPAGIAFQNFQHALRALYDRGIILAINSRNNEADVMEVFEKNPHMALGKEHFAAMRINWEDKALNLASIAEELNIGVDSMVFFDDDAVNRDLVRTMHPGVLVPELSPRPEEYAATLYDLDAFRQFALTEEDRTKGRMYAEERQRKDVARSAKDLDEYIATLEIVVDATVNDATDIPRIAQLTQKTNQFNLTTKRRTEGEVAALMSGGAFVFAADVSDKFGDYGKTLVAIVLPGKSGEAELDTFLMSCRVMGRRVEYGVMRALAEVLEERGVTKLHASFAPTAKNVPVANFLPGVGFSETDRDADTVRYAIDIVDLKRNTEESGKAITVHMHE